MMCEIVQEKNALRLQNVCVRGTRRRAKSKKTRETKYRADYSAPAGTSTAKWRRVSPFPYHTSFPTHPSRHEIVDWLTAPPSGQINEEQ